MSLTDAKTFATDWADCHHAKFAGRFVLPLLSQRPLLQNLLCSEEDVYTVADFFKYDAQYFPRRPAGNIAAVKYGYAPATKENLLSLIQQSTKIARDFGIRLNIDALVQEVRSNSFYSALYVRYINVYRTCVWTEATLTNPSFDKKQTVEVHSNIPVVISHKKPEPQPVVVSKPVEPKPAPVLDLSVPKSRTSPTLSRAEPKDFREGVPYEGSLEFSCAVSIPFDEVAEPGTVADDPELFNTLLHMPRIGLPLRLDLLGDGNDYVNRPVESTVDRDWLKGRR